MPSAAGFSITLPVAALHVTARKSAHRRPCNERGCTRMPSPKFCRLKNRPQSWAGWATALGAEQAPHEGAAPLAVAPVAREGGPRPRPQPPRPQPSLQPPHFNKHAADAHAHAPAPHAPHGVQQQQHHAGGSAGQHAGPQTLPATAAPPAERHSEPRLHELEAPHDSVLGGGSLLGVPHLHPNDSVWPSGADRDHSAAASSAAAAAAAEAKRAAAAAAAAAAARVAPAPADRPAAGAAAAAAATPKQRSARAPSHGHMWKDALYLWELAISRIGQTLG